MVAARKGHHRIVQLLIDYGMDVNAKTNAGETALSMAALRGPVTEDAALLLIKSHANVKFTVCKFRSTALHSSSQSGQVRMVQRLLERNLVAVDAKDGKGFTALLIAVDRTQEAIVRVLLARGAKPNSQLALKGSTTLVLHTAVVKKSAGIVKLLLENGADTKKKNLNGRTAEAVAQALGSTAIVQVFEEYERSRKGRRSLFG
jgi:ankyrin repeat protein